MTQSLPTYEVYVDTEGLPLDLTSPVRTTDVMYYDSGIWIEREKDRIFVPYHQVEVIREVEEPDGETAPESAAEREGNGEPTEPTDEPPRDPVE
ncbi:MAG: hypothetical protein ACOCSN_06460 [Halanaeroarchaeum sp.]